MTGRKNSAQRGRKLVPALLVLMAACGGIAKIDLSFFAVAPLRDGTGNIAIKVTEGVGTAETVIEEHLERFDENFDMASIRLPFGTERTVVATIETDEPQPFIAFGGKSTTFALEESDSPSIFIDMLPAPPAGMASIMGASGGRVSSATVSINVTTSGPAFGTTVFAMSISEDPTFPAAKTDDISQADPRLMITSRAPLIVNVPFVIDDRCADRAGCPRTIFLKNVGGGGFESPIFSVSLIYDPYPPQLLQASVSIDGGSVLGTDGTATIDLEFDEPAVPSVFAMLTGGSPSCPAQIEAVNRTLTGEDFAPDCAGTYSIEGTATDLAGNMVRLFDVATLVVDRLPPSPIELSAVTSTCVGTHPIVLGTPGAADSRAIIDASGSRARADAEGAFVVSVDDGSVSLVQIDAAGNESVSQTIEVMSCGS